MRKVMLILGFWMLVAGLSGAIVQAQDKQDKKLAKIMDDKLRFAQNLLAGIAVNDFKRIETNADGLIALSRRAEWHVIQTPKYELQSNEFRRACESIIQKAKAKNIDGVTLAYFEMTMSCVRCHQYVREIRDARLRGDEPAYLALHR